MYSIDGRLYCQCIFYWVGLIGVLQSLTIACKSCLFSIGWHSYTAIIPAEEFSGWAAPAG